MSAAIADRASAIPRDVVIEPDEHVLVATKPLAFWLPVTLAVALLWALVLYTWTAGGTTTFSAAVVVAVAVTLVAGFAWLRWRARWYILTDRRVIARWGVLNRNQAAILLERVQDLTLERPFLLSLFSEYGVLQIETAGEHSSERVSGGHHRLPMEHAERFHRALTDALTPGR